MKTVTKVEKIQGMGALPQEKGTAFRVWAPHADAVSVVGTFNDWNEKTDPLEHEEHGYWYGFVENAQLNDEYQYVIHNGDLKLTRIDPYAKQVTNSVGNGVIADMAFDWAGDDFQMPPLNELVIYEMHIGTFGKAASTQDGPGDFASAIEDLDHLKRLGVNCLELMPVAEFAGDYSWGYNPAHIFSVESAYGGPKAFKEFIKAAHQRGMAVVLDVVYNHFGPSDLDLWQFDGWHENNMGGIYFYNDWKSETPWGQTRPDYGRGEVRQYIRDNAFMWLEEYHVDGLRYDMTLFIRNVNGTGEPSQDLPEGWSLAQWINQEIREKYPQKVLIAEDLQSNEWLTKKPEEGGTGFLSQWDAQFVHPIRELLITPSDEERSMEMLKYALEFQYNNDPFQRVVYTESHDEVANGKARVTSEIMEDNPQHWFAKKRSCLGAALMMTAPGVPMLFQGQEFLEDEWFRDTVPLDWEKAEEFSGIVRLYRDLIHLRLNRRGVTRGLTGPGLQILHLDDDQKQIAFHRWYEGGAGDDVVVVMNFTYQPASAEISFPKAGHWKLRFNSDSKIYSPGFSNYASADVDVAEDPVHVSLGPYTTLIYSLEQS